MNRCLITCIVASLSTVGAAEDYPSSPTQQYHESLQRIEKLIQANRDQRDAIWRRDVLFNYTPHQYESQATQKIQVNRQKYAEELKKLKRACKKLSKEKKRLESTQIY